MSKPSRNLFTLLLVASMVLASSLLSSHQIPLVTGWTGTVVINVDGSIDPSGAPIMRVGNVYTLTADIALAQEVDAIEIRKSDITIDGGGHTISCPAKQTSGIVLNANNVTVKNFVIRHFGTGISMAGGGDGFGWRIKIINNTIMENTCGIGISDMASEIEIIGNNISSNDETGIGGSVWISNCKLSDNIIKGNGGDGISIEECAWSTISDNDIENNHNGIFLNWFLYGGSGNREPSPSTSNSIVGNIIARNRNDGIMLVGSRSNTISQNTIVENHGNGISLDRFLNDVEDPEWYGYYHCSNNYVTRNIIEDNLGYGVWFTDGLTIYGEAYSLGDQLTNNSFYHNSFISNTAGQVSIPASVSTGDRWDNGYQEAGNYWSDYSGADANHDGIGDTAYLINDYQRDRYPLMEAWKPATYLSDGFESGSFNAWTSTTLTQGETVSVVTTMQHHGAGSARFTSNGDELYENSLCHKALTSNELYARGYFLVSKSGINSDDDRFFFIVLRSGNNGLAYAGWKRIDGQVRWCLTLREGTSYYDIFSFSYSSTIPMTGQWYCVELYWRRDSKSGLVGLYVDGDLVCDSASNDQIHVTDTGAYGDATKVQFGLAELYGCGPTTVYLDCVKISNAYIGPESTPIDFEDGFESGSFSAWSSTSHTAGESAILATSPSHHGSHSAEFTKDSASGYESSYCYRTITPSDELYARGYFYVSQNGALNDDDRSYFIIASAGSQNLAYAGWRKTGGVVKWCLTLRDGTGYVDLYSSSSPSTGRWYCVELHWRKSPSTGNAEMWIDGNLIISSPGGDTANYGDATQVQFGLAEVKGGSTTVYCDCAVISSEYIGLETGKVVSSLSISLSANQVTPKHGTMITGSLVPAKSNSDVSIKYRVAGSDSWTTLSTVKTNSSSHYSYNWRPAQPGSYELKAGWAGDSQTNAADSPVVTLNCRLVKTSISISTSSSTNVAGFTINATGRLADEYGDPLSSETVFLTCRTNGTPDWQLVISGPTNSSGYYFITWLPSSTGLYSLKADWQGNETHSLANATATLSSLVYTQNVFSVETNSSTSGLAFNETDLSLRYTASGPDGTKGYARVTIAKSLITDPLKMMVYIDGLEKDFNLISQDDSWTLEFDYPHSTHQIMVDLDVTVIPEYPPYMLLPLLALLSLAAVLLARNHGWSDRYPIVE